MERLAAWGVVCGCVGAGFLANSLWIYLARRKFLRSAAQADAKVVEVRIRGLGRNAVSVPVFEFVAGARGTLRAESLMGSGLARFQVGQAVAVRYDPTNPQRAEVDTFTVLWGTALLRAGFGGLFVTMGAVGLLLS